MHETGVVRNLVRKITVAAGDAGAQRISGVEVWLGALSQFSPEHFREHFEEEAVGTLAEGAALSITASTDSMDPDAQHVVVRGLDLEIPESGDSA